MFDGANSEDPGRIVPCPPGTRILVRGVNWLGDTVMTTPALLRLREANPHASITLLTPEKLSALWQHHPAVDSVLAFSPSEGAVTLAKRLAAERFQIALILPNSFHSAFEAWLARIPIRIGYAGQLRTLLLTRRVRPRPGSGRMHKRSVREIRDLISSLAAPSEPQATGSPSSLPNSALRTSHSEVPHSDHHIHQYLHLVACLGVNPEPLAPQLFVTQDELKALRERFNLEEMPGRPFFGLNPGAEYGPAKRWPVERFIAAALEIQKRTHCRWIVFGGKSDAALAEQIATGLRAGQAPSDSNASPTGVLNLAGATSLRELCAALKLCRVLLTNDTGPMHVAAAVGTPVVVPFGSTSPELTGPGLPGDSRHRFVRGNSPCAPCFLRECPIDFRCMHSIAVENVVNAVCEAGSR